MFFNYARLDWSFALCVMEIGFIWAEGQKEERKNRVSQNGRQSNGVSELMKWKGQKANLGRRRLQLAPTFCFTGISPSPIQLIPDLEDVQLICYIYFSLFQLHFLIRKSIMSVVACFSFFDVEKFMLFFILIRHWYGTEYMMLLFKNFHLVVVMFFISFPSNFPHSTFKLIMLLSFCCCFCFKPDVVSFKTLFFIHFNTLQQINRRN